MTDDRAEWVAARTRLLDALNLLGRHRGPCGFCDAPDARHRIADTITEQLAAGSPPGEVADDHGYPTDTVLRVAVAVLAAEVWRHRAGIREEDTWADV